MTWQCAAIDHGITIFPNGKIGPCCQISADYLKPMSEINNDQRFIDLKTDTPPVACHSCISAEHNKLSSYRNFFNSLDSGQSGLQFVDIRHTNHCNLKCRYCGPHFSSQWAKELNHPVEIQKQSISQFKDILLADSVHWMYFTGGEPMIIDDHWSFLEELIHKNQANNIALLYNTNLTTLKYKDKNIIDIWKNFKSVKIQCSIDAIGLPLEYIRSGSSWPRIKINLEELQKCSAEFPKIQIIMAPVLSILNLWFVEELFKYAEQQKILIMPTLLTGPDYLALDVIPNELTELALEHADRLAPYINSPLLNIIQDKIKNNINSCLFSHTISHILLLDNLRNEKLFDLLPFKQISKNNILNNYEYK